MEDETKVLSDQEQSKAPTTQTMLKELLERVNAGFARMDARFDAIERRLHSLERRLDVFTIEPSKVKGDVLDVVNRVEDLERKAS